MSNQTVFSNYFSGVWIPLDGTFYFQMDHPSFADGAITVTAHPIEGGVGGLAPVFMEVIQMATRWEDDGAAGIHHILDIVVRNNGHAGGLANPITEFSVYTSVANP